MRIRASDYCCQGGECVFETDGISTDRLVLKTEGNRELVFCPLGNQPSEPVVALVGITPGGQSERFAKYLRMGWSVERAASAAAFSGGQPTIRRLLRAHGFAERMGIQLPEGDLNNNPQVLTTSLVKCCIRTQGSYRFQAPDIAASAMASFCVRRRFIADIEKYPSLRCAVFFGNEGAEVVDTFAIANSTLRSILEERGVSSIKLPHFSQSFQTRALYLLEDDEDERRYLAAHPNHSGYAPRARMMRIQMQRFVESL